MTHNEQRAEFEAWATSQWLVLQRTVHGEDYQDLRTQGAWEAYQAGRAALQSQGRDMVPYRCVAQAAHGLLGSAQYERLMEAIDHARRVEGDGK